MLGRNRINDLAAADRGHWRIAAQYESVTGDDNILVSQNKLGKALLPGRQFIGLQKNDAGDDFDGARMQADERPVFKRFGIGGQILDDNIQTV